jgi:heat-inducible transcriptional repressor
MELDARKQSILQAIILEYVSNAEPVGSELITQKYNMGVRSATVRGEMAEMSDLGFLDQPHTSSGRIPSDLGYRYYVDNLIVPRRVSDTAETQVRQKASGGDALQIVLRDTARALSRLTHLLTVACTFRDLELNVITLHFSGLGPKQGILVMVLSNGTVVNRMVECPPGITLEEIGQINDELGKLTHGKSMKSLVRAKAPSVGVPSTDRMLSAIWNLIKNLGRELTRGTMITEGEEFLLGQPEFQRDPGLMTELMSTFSDSEILYEALSSGGEPKAVTIGRENRSEQLVNLSLVRQSFFVGPFEAGVIGLVGPTRMRYDVVMPLVAYTGNALSEALTRFLT